MNQRSLWSSFLFYGFLIVTSSVILYPLAFMLLATFTTTDQYLRTTILPIPNIADFRNYLPVLSDCALGSCVGPAIVVTTIRALWYIAWALLISILGGYVFARLRFPFKNVIFLIFLSGLMVPSLLTTLPLYIMLARFPLVGGNDLTGQGGSGFINEWPALGILGLVNVIALFLVKQNYEMFPGDYEEAAVMDGASTWRIIFQVYVPMLTPVLTAVAILEFVQIWNDFFGPLIFVGGNAAITPVALAVQRLIYFYTQRQGETIADFGLIFAAATLMSLPTILVYLVLQRYFVQGLVGAGIKG
jgi:multiple sugar transport system permease protein